MIIKVYGDIKMVTKNKLGKYRFVSDAMGDPAYYGNDSVEHNRKFFKKIAKTYNIKLTRLILGPGGFEVYFVGTYKNLKRMFNRWFGGAEPFEFYIEKVY